MEKRQCRRLKVGGSGDMVIFFLFLFFKIWGNFNTFQNMGIFFLFCTFQFSKFSVFLNNEHILNILQDRKKICLNAQQRRNLYISIIKEVLGIGRFPKTVPVSDRTMLLSNQLQFDEYLLNSLIIYFSYFSCFSTFVFSLV